MVTRSPERRTELAADFPDVPAYDSLTDLLAGRGRRGDHHDPAPDPSSNWCWRPSPRACRRSRTSRSHPTSRAAVSSSRRRKTQGVALNVFHNRRWDADIRTLAALLKSGELGELWGVESRMDQENAATLEIGPDAGLLRDLGSHLVDQVLWLLGPAQTVYAELDHIEPEGGRTDCRFTVSITHVDGVRSRVSASKVNHIEDRELRAYGSAGSYVAHSTDVQAQAVFAGRRPLDDGDAWGYEAPERWGTLHTAAGSAKVPSEQGAYQDSLHAVRRRGARGGRVPGAGRAGRAHHRGARRRTGQRGREPRGRPVGSVIEPDHQAERPHLHIALRAARDQRLLRQVRRLRPSSSPPSRTTAPWPSRATSSPPARPWSPSQTSSRGRIRRGAPRRPPAA